MRSRMGGASFFIPKVLANGKDQPWPASLVLWSPVGDWIAYPAAVGIDLISPDGKSARKLTARRFRAYSFSKGGRQSYGVFKM